MPARNSTRSAFDLVTSQSSSNLPSIKQLLPPPAYSTCPGRRQRRKDVTAFEYLDIALKLFLLVLGQNENRLPINFLSFRSIDSMRSLPIFSPFSAAASHCTKSFSMLRMYWSNESIQPVPAMRYSISISFISVMNSSVAFDK